MQTLIVLPLQEEVAMFRHACLAHQLVPADGTVGQLVAMRVPELGLTVVPGGLGKVQLAIQTQHVLDVSRTREVVICAGAAGALVDTLAVGDVVVATETVEHDIHNHFGPPLLPRFSGAATLIESLRGVHLPRDAFTLHFGPIASGDEDVVRHVAGAQRGWRIIRVPSTVRWVAGLLALFVLVDAFLAYAFWGYPAADRHGQLLHFLRICPRWVG